MITNKDKFIRNKNKLKKKVEIEKAMVILRAISIQIFDLHFFFLFFCRLFFDCKYSHLTDEEGNYYH